MPARLPTSSPKSSEARPSSSTTASQEQATAQHDTAERQCAEGAVLRGQHWIAPYLIAYARCYGERASPSAIRRIAKGMHELEKVYPRPEIIGRWNHYLSATELRWYSVERFGETYPRWKGHQTPRPYSQTADDADRRAGLLP